MASIQQLEKLHHIHRIFQNDQSLESVVASQRVHEALAQTEHLIKQRAFLREERRRLRVTSEKLEERKRAIKFMSQRDWMGEHFKGVKGVKRIRINVGGLVFEAYETTLKKDSKSILSQLCDTDPPFIPDSDGCFVFNRDWWLFRYILAFLRDGSLPDDRTLLAQLYQEASFWRLAELMTAIEEDKLHLKHENHDKDGRPIVTKPVDPFYKEDTKKPKKWWQTVPSWWRSVIEAELEKKKNEGKKEDWWTGKPAPLKQEEKDILHKGTKSGMAVSSTWAGNSWTEHEHGEKTTNIAATARELHAILENGDRSLHEMLMKKHPPLPQTVLLKKI